MMKFEALISKKECPFDGTGIRKEKVYAKGPISAFNRAKKLCKENEFVSCVENKTVEAFEHYGRLVIRKWVNHGTFVVDKFITM